MERHSGSGDGPACSGISKKKKKTVVDKTYLIIYVNTYFTYHQYIQ